MTERASTSLDRLAGRVSHAGRYGLYFVVSGSERVIASFGQLLVAPIYIEHLGLEGYGSIVVYNLIVSVIAVMDLGMSRSVQRFVAEAEGRLSRVVLDVFSTFVLGVGSLLLLVAGGMALYGLQPVAVCALVGGALLLVVNFGVAGLRGGQFFVDAGARMSKLRVATLVAMAAMTWWTSSLVLVLCTAVLCSAVSAMFVFRAVRQRLNWTPGGAWRGESLRSEVMPFSFWAWGQSVLSFVTSNIDRLLVSTLLGPAPLAIYNLAWSISSGVSQLFVAGSTFLFPTAAARSHDLHALRRFYLTGIGALSTAAAAVCAPLYLYPGEILELWVGAEIAAETRDVLLVVLAIVPISIGGVVSGAVLNVTGRAAYLFTFMMFAHGLTCVATFLGLHYGGIMWMAVCKAVVSLVTGVVLRTATYRRVFVGVAADGSWKFWVAMTPGVVASLLLIHKGVS